MDPSHPDFDSADFWQQRFAAAHKRAFQSDPGKEDAYATIALRYFRDGLTLPWGLAVWRDILSGSWGLGKTKKQFAAKLQDLYNIRGSYRGEDEGTLTIQVLVLCLTMARREPDCLPKITPIRYEMVRSAYVQAIRHARAWRMGDVRKKRILDPWDYELLVLAHKHMSIWFEFLRSYEKTKVPTEAYHVFVGGLATKLLALEKELAETAQAARNTTVHANLLRLADPKNDPASYLQNLFTQWEDDFLLTLSALKEAKKIT